MKFEKVTIIGLGLIGGSLALALKESGSVANIIGIDTDSDSLEYAFQKGIVNHGYIKFDENAYDSNVVVIATYISGIIDIAKSLIVSDKTVVTDTGSVKGIVVEEIEKTKNLNFIGSHPIAGTEKSGVKNIVSGLFRDKITVITPTDNTSSRAADLVSDMWRLTGCKVVRLSPERHDEIFAHVSHLPHIAAFSLVNSLLERDRSFFDYLGGGLKDFSRIAESSADMWVDIFISNKEQVLDAVGNYKKSLNDIEKCISEGDRKTLKKILEAVNSIRKSST